MFSPVRKDQSGVTLVEFLVSALLLGIIMAALGSVVATVLRASVTSENEVRAAALAQQAVEEMQTVEWSAAIVYDNEAASADGIWRDRLTDRFDGEELATQPGPGADGRIDEVPELTTTGIERGNIEFRVDRYAFWVDRSGDGANDTKRFAVVVTWEDGREFVVQSERIPVSGEAAATASGTRVIHSYVSPNPADLDDDTSTNEDDIVVVFKTNRGVASGQLTYSAVEDDGGLLSDILDGVDDLICLINCDDEEVPGELEWGLQTRSMTGSQSPDDGSGGQTRWEVTIPSGSEMFTNGTSNMRFNATDMTGEPVEAFVAVTYRGGPIDGNPPSPNPTLSSDDPLDDIFNPDPPGDGDDDGDGGDDDDDGDGGDDGDDGDGGDAPDVSVITVNVPSQLCIRNNGRLDSPFQVRVRAEGLTETDGVVDVTYETIEGQGGNAERRTVTDSAAYNSGGVNNAEFLLDLPVNSNSRRWDNGDTVNFTVDVRNSGDNNDSDTSITVTATTSC